MFSKIVKYLTIGATAVLINLGAFAQEKPVAPILAFCPSVENVLEYLAMPAGADEIYFAANCTELLAPVPGYDLKYENISVEVHFIHGVRTAYIWSFMLSEQEGTPRVYMFILDPAHTFWYNTVYGEDS